MTQQQKDVKKAPQFLEVVSNFFRVIVVATSVMVVLALGGIVLGALNYVGGPVTYPGALLAAWFVSDVLLLACVIPYILFFASLAELGSSDADGGFIAIGGVLSGIVLIIAGILLGLKHLAWISLFAFLILLGCLIIDVFFLTAWLAGVRQAENE